MREIQLNRGYAAIVDDRDFDWINAFKWTVWTPPTSKTAYAMRAVKKNGIWQPEKMHRVIMGLPLLTVDHINGNGLDNRRQNLRLATQTQNSRNKPFIKGKTYKGASRQSGCDRWCAAIMVNRKRIYLGLFKELNDALRAYDEAAKQYFGEFAKLNFPGGNPDPVGKGSVLGDECEQAGNTSFSGLVL